MRMWQVGSAVLALTLAVGGCGGSNGGGGTDGGGGGRADAATCTGDNVLYLVKGGGTYTPGTTDSRTNTSGVLPGSDPITFEPFPYDGANWANVMSCVEGGLAPYDIVVTDQDPGDASHWEIVLSTSSQSVGLGTGVWALSPLTCDVVANGVGFVFTDRSTSPTLNCGVVLSELGQLLGLERVTTCDDVMDDSVSCTLDDPSRGYTDQDAHCGLDTPSDCTCDRGPNNTQNSHQLLLGILGSCPG